MFMVIRYLHYGDMLSCQVQQLKVLRLTGFIGFFWSTDNDTVHLALTAQHLGPQAESCMWMKLTIL